MTLGRKSDKNRTNYSKKIGSVNLIFTEPCELWRLPSATNIGGFPRATPLSRIESRISGLSFRRRRHYSWGHTDFQTACEYLVRIIKFVIPHLMQDLFFILNFLLEFTPLDSR